MSGSAEKVDCVEDEVPQAVKPRFIYDRRTFKAAMSLNSSSPGVVALFELLISWNYVSFCKCHR
jgi:hypothetical protein